MDSMKRKFNPLKLTLLTLTTFVLTVIFIISVLIITDMFSPNLYSTLIIYSTGAFFIIIALNFINIQKFGPAYSIMLYTIFTHFGYAIAFILKESKDFMQSLITKRHLYIDYLPDVWAISFLTCMAFIIGWQLSKFLQIKKIESIFNKDIPEKQRNIYLILAAIIIYIFFIVLFYNTVKYGLIGKSYIFVKNVMSIPSLSYLQRLFWIATIPIIVFGNKRDYLINSIPLIGITLILMLTGNRNDILIPLAIGFSIFTLINKKILKFPLIIGLLTIFILNPLISSIRQTGVLSLNNISLGIESALMEMGLQVNPLSVIAHLTDNGLNQMNGRSIFLPSLAILNLNMFYSTTDFLTSDFSIQLILEKQGHLGQGFSMLGEMWLNFGIIGVMSIYFFYGVISKKIENKIQSKFGFLIYGQISIVLMYWVRNALLFNVILVIFSIILYIITMLIGKIKKN